MFSFIETGLFAHLVQEYLTDDGRHAEKRDDHDKQISAFSGSQRGDRYLLTELNWTAEQTFRPSAIGDSCLVAPHAAGALDQGESRGPTARAGQRRQYNVGVGGNEDLHSADRPSAPRAHTAPWSNSLPGKQFVPLAPRIVAVLG